jgi:hypothetical protein
MERAVQVLLAVQVLARLLVKNPRPSSKRKSFDGQAKVAKLFLLHDVK